MSEYQQNLAEDVEYAKSGFRALYGIKEDTLPETMGFGEQMIFVIDILSKRKDRISNLDSNIAANITKSLQDNNGNISVDGLKFLERIIDVSEELCEESTLTDSIQSVKGEEGFIDTGKAGLFVSILALGGISLRNTIKEVRKCAVR